MTQTTAQLAASRTLASIAVETVKADPSAPLVDLLDAARYHPVYEARAELCGDDDCRILALGDAMDACILTALKEHGEPLREPTDTEADEACADAMIAQMTPAQLHRPLRVRQS